MLSRPWVLILSGSSRLCQDNISHRTAPHHTTPHHTRLQTHSFSCVSAICVSTHGSDSCRHSCCAKPSLAQTCTQTALESAVQPERGQTLRHSVVAGPLVAQFSSRERTTDDARMELQVVVLVGPVGQLRLVRRTQAQEQEESLQQVAERERASTQSREPVARKEVLDETRMDTATVLDTSQATARRDWPAQMPRERRRWRWPCLH